jgi:AGZA family xanthine/uracil permease-like MFS transporter
MMCQVTELRFEDAPMSEVIPAFLAIIMMPFTFSIANGIMFGILSYVALTVIEGRIREIRPVMWISAAMFAVYVVLG